MRQQQDCRAEKRGEQRSSEHAQFHETLKLRCIRKGEQADEQAHREADPAQDTDSVELRARCIARPVREAEVHALLNLATDRLGLGRLKEARADLEQVRRQISEIEYARFRWLARLHAIDAEIALAEGNPAHASGAADSCLGLAAEYGMPKYEIRGRIAKARALAREGRLAPARKQARGAATSIS